ncbi:MAG: lysine transporter LysE [Candidatus Auribacter fodinae]|uniref:Lysine transporter LysE n=1 Tax=Candidatus Auribacter fodinae TaxID=2093366 RepID=A0A3A4R151_9BACT|nr:MAG: lysine transporter LysE [Candidatus Auribacter fodinae]
MDLISLFSMSFIIALSGALMPGPLLAAVMNESLRNGSKAGPLMTLGHAIPELIIVALIAMGLTYIMNIQVIIKSIALLGSAVLFFFGISMIFNARNTHALQHTPQQSSCSWMVIRGLVMSITNPYWSLWWLTVGGGLIISAQKSGLIGLAIFFSGHIIADLAWYTFVSISLAKSKKLISPNVYRWIIMLCGGILVIFALLFLKELTC